MAVHPEARLQLWCQDEARFGQKGRTTRVWYERGVRPPGVVDQRFESLYLFAAWSNRPEFLQHDRYHTIGRWGFEAEREII